MIHRYRNNGFNIVLDVNSGSVHVVDDVTYEVIPLFEEGKEKEEIVTLLKDKYAVSDIEESFDEITQLKEDGSLFTEDIYRQYIKEFKKRQTVVKAMCLHIAHDCNLACKYCFAEEGEYHGRRALMSYEVGKKALDFLIENSGKRVATSQQSVAADAQQETAGNAAEKQQDIPEKPKTEKCIHDGISRCTLPEEDKEKDGTGKDCAHHCCWNCVKRDGCNIECYASSKRKTLDDDEEAAEDGENAEQPAEPIEFDRKTLEDMIRNAQGALDRMCDYWVENQPYTYAKYNMMIQAYKLLLKEHDESDQKLDPVEQQPELPLLKNDKQRAEFIDAYEEWPLWIDNQETGEKYYRYELPDGTSFVIKTYHAMLYNYDALEYGNYKEGYGENEQYLLKPGKFFRDCRTNRSTLIDKLKELQKAGS